MKDYKSGEWLTELTDAQRKGLEKLLEGPTIEKDLPDEVLAAIAWADWVINVWWYSPHRPPTPMPVKRPHLPDPRVIVEKRGRKNYPLNCIRNSYAEYFCHGFGLIACLHLDQEIAEESAKFYRHIYKKMYGKFPSPGRSGLNMLLVR